jgi:hypothetical protein
MKFKKNISIKTILMAFILVFAIKMELDAKFLVSDIIYEYSRLIFIICILIVVTSSVYFRKRLQQNLVNAKRSGQSNFLTRRPILFYSSGVIFFTVILFMLSVKVLPHLYTVAFGDVGEMTVQVYDPHYEESRHVSCGYGFTVHLYLLAGGKVCDIKRELWKTLKQNDFVKLEGKMTWFGIIPYSVVKLTNP